MDEFEAKYYTENPNEEQNLRSSNYIDSNERNEKTHRRTNKNSQKKRVVKNKKKKKISKIIDSSIEASVSIQKDTPKNPYRIFLLYKLRKKYDVKMHVYDMKKVNELIFNIPSHFTAIFKEYLLKEEEAEFLKRIYHKNELNKKLKNIFYFYEKYSKIFPNYIVIPEGHYLYRNILKKQKMIDKLQRMKEEETKNKKKLLDLSFNTIFTNGAIDSIYSNNNIDPLNNLSNIISMDYIGKNEEQEVIQIQNIIKNIENHENVIGIKDMKSLDKKQIIYKKEFRNLRSLSKSTFLQNGKEVRGKSKEYERKKFFPDNKDEKYASSQVRTKERKRKNKIYKFNSPNMKRNETKESEDENENQNDSISIRMSKNVIVDSVKNSNNANEDKSIKNKYKRVKKSKEKNSKNQNEEKYDKYRSNEVESSKINKKKKFIVLRGNRHYFIKNRENEEKSSDFTNDEKNLTYKSKNLIDDEKEIFYSKHYKINKNNNSFSQNKNLRKDDSIKNQNFILYKKKLCNGSRGLSISKKNNENDIFVNNSRRMYRINTNFTTNGAKITPVRKYLVNDQQNIYTRRQDESDLHQDKWKKIMNENIERHSNYNSQNFRASTYASNNLELTFQNKNTDSLNGNSSNIYHKKYKIDNLRNSYMDKSCPKNYNKFLTDMDVNKKKEYANNNYSNEDKINDQSNNEVDNNNHRYYRTSQHNNNKKFKLRAPKNYYKIDLD
jgi:hypothetical protein